MKKTGRTISGVTPVAVMTKPLPCPGKCVYCPTFSGSPQSYTPESPAVIRARFCEFDAKKQVEMRLKILSEMGHPTDKVELIIMGGTFLAAPEDYQYQFVKDCYDALNGVASASLEEAKRLNETAANRCVTLCIETRPDVCSDSDVKRLLEFGATRVELGVQTLDNKIYEIIRRGHTVQDVVAATKRLKDAGIKVHYHWMPGLPGATPERDFELSKLLFEDERFRPDGLKLYPTMVVEGTEMEKWYKAGTYTPYPDETMIDLICRIKEIVPRYVRISRVLRDIPAKYITGGLKDSLRDIVKVRMKARGTECQCIRCREYGHRAHEKQVIGLPELHRMDYEASGGHEIFLTFDDANWTLFGMLRLRIQSTPAPGLPAKPEGKYAVVRELHIWGAEVPIKRLNDKAAQHKGLGKALLHEAERIAQEEYGLSELVILSGVGAKEYYKNEFGYQVEVEYLVRRLSLNSDIL